MNDIMEIIDPEDIQLLKNKRIVNMSRMDWAKTMSISNQFIQKNILKLILCPFGYNVHSCDDKDFPSLVDISNNSPGFDLLIISPTRKHIKVQSKLRQVNGVTDFSTSVHFETTRRNSDKNKEKNHTGHICYSSNEFDYVMISLVNDKYGRERITNCNLWSYVFIPITDLIDHNRNCCVSNISSLILKKNIIDITNPILPIDILSKCGKVDGTSREESSVDVVITYTENSLNKLKILKLKEILKSQSKSIGGKKSDLIERILKK